MLKKQVSLMFGSVLTFISLKDLALKLQLVKTLRH